MTEENKIVVKSNPTVETIRQIGEAVRAVKTIRGHVRSFKKEQIQAERFTMTVEPGEEMYFEIRDWLTSLVSSENKHHFSLHTMYEEDEEGASYRSVHKTFSVEGLQVVEHEGITFMFELVRRKEDGLAVQQGSPSVVIIVDTEEELATLVEHMTSLGKTYYGAGETRDPNVRMYHPRNGWTRISNRTLRGLDTVVTREGVADRIVADLKTFLSQEEKYVRRGIPWHRGLLMHGKPGTGKTSLAKALAMELGLDLYFLSMSDMRSDRDLIERTSQISGTAILLLEDVDSFKPMTDREAEGITMSGMLNVLDGVTSPHGLIVIMTTNHIEKLDDAIIRPGRIDMVVEIEYPDVKQANKLFEVFYEQPPKMDLDPQGHSTAELMEVFKRNMDDAEAAERAVHNGEFEFIEDTPELDFDPREAVSPSTISSALLSF